MPAASDIISKAVNSCPVEIRKGPYEMAYEGDMPRRVRTLVLGGGVHGVGVLHDLASRGWTDVHLVEKNSLASGTSSRSTKLIHGGLRYLRHAGQVHMVAESLRERRLLLSLAPDIVEPIELLVPIVKGDLKGAVTAKLGLTLYDVVANRNLIKVHRRLQQSDVLEKAPVLDSDAFGAVYSFWDAQTDDLALVGRIAESACALGASISENCEIISITKEQDGWLASVRTPGGEVTTISALYVVNCLGPWADRFLLSNHLEPKVIGFNNKGVHLLVEDLGLRSGLFLPEREQAGRFIFMLPWRGYTLIGTTEELFDGDPDRLVVTERERDYLLGSVIVISGSQYRRIRFRGALQVCAGSPRRRTQGV